MDIQKIARSIAKKYQTANPFQIAKERHIKILYAPLGKVMGFHSYSLRLHVIHLNQELDEPMLQFVCAHELGHTILHPDINTAFMTHRTFFSYVTIQCTEAMILGALCFAPSSSCCQMTLSARTKDAPSTSSQGCAVCQRSLWCSRWECEAS